MDGTLTESRTQINKNMCQALRELIRKGANIVVISGAEISRMKKQMKGAPKKIFYMAQCGNSCEYWENILTERQKDAVSYHIELIKSAYKDLFEKVDHEDLTQDRGCQITFSFVGHHQPLEVKKKFDPSGDRRAKILKDTAFISNNLIAKVAGTTCFDYTNKGGEKGDNIKKLMAREGWLPNDCVYVGDAIRPNANDESVIGVVPNLIRVGGPSDVLKVIKKLCK